MTQARLAQKLGVKAPAVTQWENGKTRLSGENLLKAAKIFAVNPEWLLTGRGSQASLVSEAALQHYRIDTQNAPESLAFIQLFQPDHGTESASFIGLSRHIIDTADVPADKALLWRVTSNNMAPVLPQHTLVALDTRTAQWLQEGDIYAVEYGGLVRLHRLFKLTGQRLRLANYNETDYREQEVTEAEVRILGRAFWWAVTNPRSA